MGDIKLSEEEGVRHINNNTACTAPAVRSRWGNPSNRKVADIYLSTPALRHWEAPRRTTVDACNQPADKRKINRRLKPHRRPCAHFWSGSKPYGGPPRVERSLLPQLLTTDIRGYFFGIITMTLKYGFGAILLILSFLKAVFATLRARLSLRATLRQLIELA